MVRNRRMTVRRLVLLLLFGISTCDALSAASPRFSDFDEKVSLSVPYSKDGRKTVKNNTPPTSTIRMQACGNYCLLPKRNKRVVTMRRQSPPPDDPGPNSQNANAQAVLSPFPTLDPIREKKTGKNQRRNRNNKALGPKKNSSILPSEELEKASPSNDGLEKKGRKKSQLKKSQVPVREGQTSRRLRQHMQHKKKVKHFLQKRIQEQIEQRSQKQDSARIS